MEQATTTIFEVVRCPVVAVIGSSQATTEQLRLARRIGRLLAGSGVTVVTGGRGGVMEAASQGASQAGGLTVGILPGSDEAETPPNRFVQIAVYTGLSEARNAVVVKSAGAVVAIGGGPGTLSEIGLALASGRPVILLDSWQLNAPPSTDGAGDLLHTAGSVQEAAALAVALAAARSARCGLDPAEQGDASPAEVSPVEGSPVEVTRAEGTRAEGTRAGGTRAEGSPVEGSPAEGSPAEDAPPDPPADPARGGDAEAP